MMWRQETYRAVLQRGDVDIGAVYPPVGRGRLWRWRIWVTVSGHPSAGREANQTKARQHVEGRFQAFLDAAQLAPMGGDA
ncbi:hypothetical protein HFO09_23275 [Rhizobium laguerreae]|uniref:hypothetical protein n=1 Tax=Rhizobium laguerreae TaxID=1076926 RepID=UPI001C90C05F|nr:hypothetical protein [Rhizobium laguerreae]MBY3257079.1 hypothetical protein [Rhizobium laguerreae]MBY3282440.1 hypothetical protein [Rhizobium laguerreae]MBY3291967.1 hypothetical protein [Rhizobium laguerreae]